MIEKTNYLKDINFLINNQIYEYDISKANINILFRANMISEDEYNRLLNAPREVRQKDIGIKILRDNNIYKIINQGIIEMRNIFMEVNNISDEQILSAKNDALFIIGEKPKITKFDNVEFVLKNVYNSFFLANNLEFYYFVDTINNIETLHVKGISDENLYKHKDYMVDFLKALFGTIQLNIKDAIIMLRYFYNQYINNELDVRYYRNFDSISLYTIEVNNSLFNTDIITNLQYINKNCNLNLLRDLWQIITFIDLNM